VTLIVARLQEKKKELSVRQAAWYMKEKATFSDTLLSTILSHTSIFFRETGR
jgi:hypothetical protein